MISINKKPQLALRKIENLQVIITDAITYIKAYVVNSAAKSILLKID